MASGYIAENQAPNVTHVPAFEQVTIAASATSTVTFENTTAHVVIQSNTDVIVGVSTAGVAGTSSFRLRGTTGSGPTIPLSLPIQTKQLVFSNPSSTDAIYVSYCATLTRGEAADFPALTSANGFEKVE